MTVRKSTRDVPENYGEYRLNIGQIIAAFAVTALGAMVAAFIFYKNIWISAVVALLTGLFGPKYYSRMLRNRRAAELNLQFKDMLYVLNSSMSAGKTLEEALRGAQKDMHVLYMNDQAIILRELDNMVAKLDINMTVTELFNDLARRSGNDEIRSFADVLSNGLSKGINQVNLVQKTVRVLAEKLEIKQEIATRVAAIRMEQRIMLIMPVALMLMIHLMAPDYMQTLYDSPWGYPVITVALTLIGISVLLARKIMNIKV